MKDLYHGHDLAPPWQARSDANVRKTNAQNGLEALAASIAEHGLLQPLIISPSAGKKTLYDVHAGGRRWRAIGLLIERGTLPKDYAVDVRLCENEAAAAREISLAENLLREAMTRRMRQAYREIIAQGAGVEDVARRFGVTMRHVQGRLRLADLAEPIFNAWPRARSRWMWRWLAVSPAIGAQLAHGNVCPELAEQQCAGDPPRDCESAVGQPVGAFRLTEYTGAGGCVEGDLFTGEGQGMWLDGELALELAQAKLQHEAEVAALATKLGWVAARDPCSL
jgi:ParB family chromosome partitioning protein